MNRRSFVRWLGLAPAAAILPLSAPSPATCPVAGTRTLIEGGKITCDSITVTSLRIADANLGEIVAGRVRSGDARTRIDLDNGTISLEG